MIVEAKIRGIKTENNELNLVSLHIRQSKNWGKGMPKWYFNDAVMAKVVTTHKANLYRKDPFYYANFVDSVANEDNEPCCERCQYYWIAHKEEAYAV
jgi:hypothetical protein